MPVQTGVSLIGVSEMRALLRDLPKDLQKEIRPAVREAAEVVAAKARSNAAFSTRIPGAIKARARFAGRQAGAEVVVDSVAAPHARPINGRGARGSTFRHPVPGSDRWVPQPVIPFLDDAAREKEREAALLVQAALEKVLRRAK